MPIIGKINNFNIVKKVTEGVYIDAYEYGSVFVRISNIGTSEDFDVGNKLKTFIYYNDQRELIATVNLPLIEVGGVAYLKVVELSKYGAHLDWGLDKDLFVPFSEQKIPMQKGKSYVVYAYIDGEKRIAASSKLYRYLDEDVDPDQFKLYQKVNLLIANKTNLGIQAVINNLYLGLIHNIDILYPIEIGAQIDGYIKKIRHDGLIDLYIQPYGSDAIDQLSQEILHMIQKSGDKFNINDKSSPDEIYRAFKVSKSNYKKAIGKLYKQRLIIIENNKIKLNN